MSDIFQNISDFFESIGFGKNRHRVIVKKSGGFEKYSLNLCSNKFSIDYSIERSTRERKGSNKKIKKFDSSNNFNSSYFFDE
jgi:hypothetical protein